MLLVAWLGRGSATCAEKGARRVGNERCIAEWKANLQVFGDMKSCDSPAGCEEIRIRLNAEERHDVVSGRHVNWILRKVPQLARRVRKGGRWAYEILPAGRAYVEAVRLRSAGTVDDVG